MESNAEKFRGKDSLERQRSWKQIVGIGIKVLIWIFSRTFSFPFQWEKWESVSSSVEKPSLICFPCKSHEAVIRAYVMLVYFPLCVCLNREKINFGIETNF